VSPSGRIGKLVLGHTRTGGDERGADWYDKDYAKSAAYGTPYYRSRYYPIWAVIADRIRQARPGRILEVGCGSGQLARYLIDDAGAQVYVGIDFSPKAIELARRQAPEATFVVGDARDAAVYERECDVIICTEVLEHISDDLTVISLFPSGTRCLCTVPDFPYPSHVRHFASLEVVVERYGAAFADLDVMVFKASGSRRYPVVRYFLMDGVRL
jgi:SAM-dependent methyltransferase